MADFESSCSGSEPNVKSGLKRQVTKWENARLDKPLRVYHECLAEMFGTCVVIMFGDGIVASLHMQQAQLKLQPGGQVDDHFAANQYVNMGWGLGVAFGVMVSFETSGAHLSPAVTLNDMIFGNMSLARGLLYMASQMLGAILGAFLVTINYVVFKGGDALTNFYCTSPFPGVSHANAFFQEVLCTALLLAGISAIGSGNPPVNKFHIAGFVGALVFAIGNCFGMQTGYAMSPARDLGPRLVWAVFYAGYQGGDVATEVFGSYWWIPVVAPMIGGPLGGLVYRLCNHPQRRVEIAPATNTGFNQECASV